MSERSSRCPKEDKSWHVLEVTSHTSLGTFQWWNCFFKYIQRSNFKVVLKYILCPILYGINLCARALPSFGSFVSRQSWSFPLLPSFIYPNIDGFPPTDISFISQASILLLKLRVIWKSPQNNGKSLVKVYSMLLVSPHIQIKEETLANLHYWNRCLWGKWKKLN